MGPRSRFGASPLRLAIWLAIVLLAAGASATISGVAGDSVHLAARPHNSVYQLPPQFELRPSCPFVTLDPYGACPQCDGLGVQNYFDQALVVPDESLSLKNGAVAPSQPLLGSVPLTMPPRPWTRRAVISLCSEALCGSGFRPGDTILLLATRTEGSTFWRTVADGAGNFRSPLPAPLCRFAPIGLTASDNHAHRSNLLSLGSTGCQRATP